jgi:ABC-type nitrate/sulfonate/bicarbonate transport system substrate-binding protein
MRYGLGGVAVALAPAALTACGDDADETAADEDDARSAARGSGESTQTTSPQLSLTMAGSSSGTGAFLAQTMADVGESSGISIEVRVMSPTDAELAVINRQIDMGLFGILSVVNAHAADHDLVMVAPNFASHSSLFAGTDSEATSLADLRGARLGCLPRVSAQYTDLRQIAAEQDLDLESDFELSFGDAQLQEGLFRQGQLDAFCPFEPNATRLVTSGDAKEVFQFSKEWERMFDAPLLSIGWVASREWVEETGGAARIRETNAQMVRELTESADRFHASAELFGLPDADAVDELAERMNALMVPEWTDDVVENLQHRLDRAAELDLIPSRYDIEELIDR